MRKHLIRAICILGVLVVLVSCLPLSAFAVDPVSASVIANSFAQAIAAYGASNGVAMTFDVGSTNGIGETVHELWSDFRAGTQDADDYETLAAALFPNLYYKALSAAGTAAEAYTVGVSITSEYAEEFDNFYNWLLSGPAEMVRVDNESFQFAPAQIGAASSPINVVGVQTSGFADSVVPFVPAGQPSWKAVYDLGLPCFRSDSTTPYLQYNLTERDGTSTKYVFGYYDGSSFYSIVASTAAIGTIVSVSYNSATNAYSGLGFQPENHTESSGLNWVFGTSYGPVSSSFISYIPVFPTRADGLAALSSYIADPSATVDSVGVKAYTNTGIADIPDTTDSNYDALGRAKDIPLGIPWDDLIYGDGTGALSDAQSGAIADEIAGVLETDSVIPLVEEAEAVNPRPDPDDDPSGDPDDYAVLGLEDVFPFCIPFDIYAFLSALAADPVPPSFTCTFDFPEVLGGTQTIELDFDTPTFNQLAQLLRLLELLAFIVGLALLTRSMFIRG